MANVIEDDGDTRRIATQIPKHFCDHTDAFAIII